MTARLSGFFFRFDRSRNVDRGVCNDVSGAVAFTSRTGGRLSRSGRIEGVKRAAAAAV